MPADTPPGNVHVQHGHGWWKYYLGFPFRQTSLFTSQKLHPNRLAFTSLEKPLCAFEALRPEAQWKWRRSKRWWTEAVFFVFQIMRVERQALYCFSFTVFVCSCVLFWLFRINIKWKTFFRSWSCANGQHGVMVYLGIISVHALAFPVCTQIVPRQSYCL